MAWLSNDLQPDRAQPKGLIVNARILWAFSAAYRAFSEPVFRQMTDRAFQIVMNNFWDHQYGGAYWQLDCNGQVLDDSKKTYGQAFYIYALVEYHLAFEAPAALERARQLFELVESTCHDSQFGGYWEVRRRDWSEAADTRLSAKDMNEKKSMNNHLHRPRGLYPLVSGLAGSSTRASASRTHPTLSRQDHRSVHASFSSFLR